MKKPAWELLLYTAALASLTIGLEQILGGLGFAAAGAFVLFDLWDEDRRSRNGPHR